MRTKFWINLTTEDISKLSRNTIIIVPFSAIEQHGPHLPLSTDKIILDKILEKFIKLSSKRKGKIDATLISSKNLSQDERNIISKEISKAIKSNIEFTFKVDKSLISGIKIQVGSLLIDTSVRNKLKRIKQLMTEN